MRHAQSGPQLHPPLELAQGAGMGIEWVESAVPGRGVELALPEDVPGRECGREVGVGG